MNLMPARVPDEPYRPCAAAVVQNEAGMILICERRDFAESWQFPQGGIDEGETPREALARELMEEISLPPSAYQIKEERPGYRYHFPERHRKRGKFIGQEQVYFCVAFRGWTACLTWRRRIRNFAGGGGFCRMSLICGGCRSLSGGCTGRCCGTFLRWS